MPESRLPLAKLPATTDPMKPSEALLIKLASIIGHIEEYNTTGGSTQFLVVISHVSSPEIREWMKQMRAKGLAPIPRTGA